MTDSNSRLMAHMVAKARAKCLPFCLTIELNRFCNLHCGHCYHGQFDGHSLSLEQLDLLWPQLLAMGTLSLTFTGGEVLAHPEFLPILQAARKYRFQLSFISNLTLLTPSMAREISAAGVSLVRTSLYFANAADHDRFVGREGAFDATIHGLDLLAGLGVATKVQVVLMEDNIRQLAALEKIAARHRAGFGGVFFMDPCSNGDKRPLQLAPTVGTLRAVADSAEPSILLTPWMNRLVCGEESCGAGTFSAFIDADFGLRPCINWPVALGTLDGENFVRLWNGPAMEQVRKMLQGEATCKKCPRRQYCSPCPALNLQENGTVDIPYGGRCSEAAGYAAVFAGMAHEGDAAEDHHVAD